ncbi:MULTISPECIES: hypothetical protein [Pseudoalteromonas]|nr:hypothetical protein [Pseudoalteromonas sp. A757]RXE88155.1 hypothetical protein DRB05_04350 [Pseudoalteromonas sp. A757]
MSIRSIYIASLLTIPFTLSATESSEVEPLTVKLADSDATTLSFGGGSGPVACSIKVESESTRTCKYLYWGDARNPFTGQSLRSQSGSAEAKPSNRDSRVETIPGRWITAFIDTGSGMRTIHVPTYTEGSLNKSNYNPGGEIPSCPRLTSPIEGKRTFSKYHPGRWEGRTYIQPWTEYKTAIFTAYPSLNNNVETSQVVTDVSLISCRAGLTN